MPRVVHFDLGAEDPERALKFYEEVFGWHAHKWEGPHDYWLIHTGDEQPGIDGGIHLRHGPPVTINTIGVDNLDEFTRKVATSGGKVTMSKMAIPGVGYMAHCEDTEGNCFGIMEPDRSAA